MPPPVAGGRDRLTHGLQPAGWPGRRRYPPDLWVHRRQRGGGHAL